ncbi:MULTISPECIES: MoaD/ThiS family protein [Acinetobacter]|uniref:Molybdopterin converting factor, subunit 1 n=1 Tax=Acinetobacter parvus DSM 16617 = CIP 108168 TaxID=981333 RepID=N8RNN5_9GAMM|nr:MULTISPECIES: MoaD/ThiS family protein [Acinetobacter]ENU36998.1 hypothetical protein F988_00805 [Acinetobacter parvus DSM 16617 = CIP 108168]ENU84770.1 hypothetical protein F974_00074 [Acinetobacter sp. CIP 102159]ENU90257.1 hypothetical protein F972_00405 [Acinetobacter sp. CIP 102529]ENU97174.1 hypothetical protein F970_00142 [Acinetobacter sp. CIP 102082]MCU4394899.1 MoaD/ThiS family protein [Acinetobacter parvus]
MFSIDVVAFGKISEYLPESFELKIDTQDESITINQALKMIATHYPTAVQALDKCACAIEDKIVTRKDTISKSDQLVLLSPVAGG